MKINKQNILLVIIACLAAYSIFQGHGVKTDVAAYNAKIDSIQNEIDSIEHENTLLNNQIHTIDKEINNIDGDINNVSKNITIIKKQTNEKIDSVNTYNFSDLEKFFSQSVTKTSNDTLVGLKVPVAKLVIKDLISGDGAKQEVVDLNKIIALKDGQITLFKEKDSLKDQKITNLEAIITKKDEQFGLERQKSESLLKELKQQKFKGFFYKMGSVVGIVATSLLLLK